MFKQFSSAESAAKIHNATMRPWPPAGSLTRRGRRSEEVVLGEILGFLVPGGGAAPTTPLVSAGRRVPPALSSSALRKRLQESSLTCGVLPVLSRQPAHVVATRISIESSTYSIKC